MLLLFYSKQKQKKEKIMGYKQIICISNKALYNYKTYQVKSML